MMILSTSELRLMQTIALEASLLHSLADIAGNASAPFWQSLILQRAGLRERAREIVSADRGSEQAAIVERLVNVRGVRVSDVSTDLCFASIVGDES